MPAGTRQLLLSGRVVQRCTVSGPAQFSIGVRQVSWWIGLRLWRPSSQASSRRVLEYYFHAVVAAIEQVASEDNPSRLGHLERMEEIYCSLLGPATTRKRCVGKRGRFWTCRKTADRRGRQRARLDRMKFQKERTAQEPGH